MLLAALLDGPHGIVVEVGSGSGIATRCFPHLPGNRLAVGVDVERGDLRKAAVASEVYEHLTRPEAFIEEVRRILKPGGRLILTTPNTKSVVLMLLRLLPRERAKAILSRSGERQQFLHPEFFNRYD